MPQFRIVGANRSTGQDTTQTFTADTEDAAIRAAGVTMVIEKVIRLPDPPRPVPAAVPYATPVVSPRVAWYRDRVMIGCAAGAVVLLVALGLLMMFRAVRSSATAVVQTPPVVKPKLLVADVARGIDANLFAEEKKTIGGERILLGETPSGDVMVRISASGEVARYAHMVIQVPRSFDPAWIDLYTQKKPLRDDEVKGLHERLELLRRFIGNTCPGEGAFDWAQSVLKSGTIGRQDRTWADGRISVELTERSLKFAVSIDR
jgi:hypothetical protein